MSLNFSDTNTTDYIVTGYEGQGITGAGAKSISLWAKLSVFGASDAYVSVGGAGGGSSVSMANNGSNVINYYNNGNTFNTSGGRTADTWHHIIWSRSGADHGSSTIFIDGLETSVGHTNSGNLMNLLAGSLQIGRNINDNATTINDKCKPS